MSINYRRATSDDAEVLVEFNCRLATETEDKSLPRETVARGVDKGLTPDSQAIYFVAETNERVIGQLMITREWSDWRNGWMIWIQSVYVDADHRGQGVFRGLFEFVRDEVIAEGNVVMMRLYVENENSAAQATYRRLGFVDPGYQVMELPID